MDSDPLFARIRDRELALHLGSVRNNESQVERVLHPEFREFGRSGATYTRAEAMAALLTEVSTGSLASQDWHFSVLANDVVLVTYRTAFVDELGARSHYTNRSSLWKCSNSVWQVVFHQGTPCGPFDVER